MTDTAKNIVTLPKDEQRDPKRLARTLYWMGWSLLAIEEHLGIKYQTLYAWRARQKWDAEPILNQLNFSAANRIIQLHHKPAKSNADYKELSALEKHITGLAKVERYQNGGNQRDLNDKLNNRYDAPRKPQNEITEDMVRDLRTAFMDELFGYQKLWYEVGNIHRIRNILKSRQIGATYFFAREALLDALTTGRNQIFLSASKAQAFVFRSYIIQFVRNVTGVELRGEVLKLDNNAELYFLGTNFRTAQSYHGNVYMDEIFWIHGFEAFRKVASGMAMHKKWRLTYFSTPSAITHDAYDFWAATKFKNKFELDISHKALAGGRLCEDGQWRQIVTLLDAQAQGCDLFDIEQLRLEYSDDEFKNLLMCEFMDDSLSEFKFDVLQSCMKDSWVTWTDFRPFAPRPLGDLTVAIGYDPSLGGDGAGIVVVALPSSGSDKFRIVEKMSLHCSPEEQVKAIRGIMARYRVEFIGMDTQGCGQAAFALLKPFFPHIREFNYNPEVKHMLIIKAQEVMKHGRLEFDAGDKDLVSAFTSVKRTLTASGKRVTFESDRRGKSHGDLAWATMHALAWEPLGGKEYQPTVIVESF